MDYYQYNPSRVTPTYPSFTSTSGFNQSDNNRDQRYMDSYGRSIVNPLPAIFRTATAHQIHLTVHQRHQQEDNNLVIDQQHQIICMIHHVVIISDNGSSGYISDTNDLRRSSISIRPTGGAKFKCSTYWSIQMLNNHIIHRITSNL